MYFVKSISGPILSQHARVHMETRRWKGHTVIRDIVAPRITKNV